MNSKKKRRLMEDEVVGGRANLVYEILKTIPKEDRDRAGLGDTPLRVGSMYDELFSGYLQDPKEILEDAMFVDEGKKNVVLVKDIPFYSTCEHHMMPFFGTVTIAYIPQDGRIVGLSKLARLVDVFARRLQVQERIGQQIMDTLKEVMNPFGAAVIIKARHTCMEARGVNKVGAYTVTSTLDGVFFLDDKARDELFQLMQI